MEKLTKKQIEILTIIKKYIAEHGFPPTVRELCLEANLSSTATVFVHLKHLMNKGYIKQANSKFRTLELLVPNEYVTQTEDVINVALLGLVPAGNLNEAIERPDEYFSLPAYMVPKNKEVFTLKVHGESMINAGIYDNDIVIIERTKNANNGDIVVALTEEGDTTLKTFYKENGYIRLQPENDHMEPIILANVSIVGKAIGLYRKF